MSDAKNTITGSTRVANTKPHGPLGSASEPKTNREPSSAVVIAAFIQWPITSNPATTGGTRSSRTASANCTSRPRITSLTGNRERSSEIDHASPINTTTPMRPAGWNMPSPLRCETDPAVERPEAPAETRPAIGVWSRIVPHDSPRCAGQ